MRSIFITLFGLLSMIIKKIKLAISKFKNYKSNKKLKIEVSKPEEIINKSENQIKPRIDSHKSIEDNQVNEEKNNENSLNDILDQSDVSVTSANGMKDAANKVVDLALRS